MAGETARVTVAGSVWTAWRRMVGSEDEPAITLLVRSEADPHAVLEALAAGDDDHYALVVTAKGAAVYLEEPDDLAAKVQLLVERLERAGIAAHLEPLREARLRLPRRSDHVIAQVRLAGHLAARSRGRPTWLPTPDALEAAAQSLVTWCADEAPPRRPWQLQLGLVVTSVAVDDRQGVATFLERALRRPGGRSDGLVTLSWQAGGRYRSATVNAGSGSLTLLRGGPDVADGGWEQPLAAARAALVAAREHAVYGYLRRGQRPTIAGIDDLSLAAPDWVPIERFVALEDHGLLMESWKVPDAFGVQLLTRGHPLTPLGDAWEVERLDDRVRLVSHRDPAAWFSTPLPPLELVAQARDDFGDLVFTAPELWAVFRAVQRTRPA